MVVFCLCAFILAIPTAVLAGISNAAKYGIIVRSGDAVERLSKIKRIAFDKTGTLTYGKPQVAAIVSADVHYSENDILRMAALTEQKSEHPLGKAILNAYESQGGTYKESVDFRLFARQGVSANIDGHTVLVGKEDFMQSQNINICTCIEKSKAELDKGATIVYVTADGKLAGFISLRDIVRHNAKETLDKLKAAGITPMLLTGDNRHAAGSIASAIGIEDVRANLLPQEKMDIIKGYSGSAEPVCMVGDSVNDALALSSADAGIAMGGIGSDIAIESADAILVGDEIKRLPYLFTLMQKVMKKIHVNIIASLIINITAVILSALGVLTPVKGALWHNFGSVFVVVNAALLLRVKDN